MIPNLGQLQALVWVALALSFVSIVVNMLVIVLFLRRDDDR